MWDEQSRGGQQDASTAIQPRTAHKPSRLIDSIATHATARVFALAAISGRQSIAELRAERVESPDLRDAVGRRATQSKLPVDPPPEERAPSPGPCDCPT